MEDIWFMISTNAQVTGTDLSSKDAKEISTSIKIVHQLQETVFF